MALVMSVGVPTGPREREKANGDFMDTAGVQVDNLNFNTKSECMVSLPEENLANCMSPTVDFGIDFEAIIRQCIADRKIRRQQSQLQEELNNSNMGADLETNESQPTTNDNEKCSAEVPTEQAPKVGKAIQDAVTGEVEALLVEMVMQVAEASPLATSQIDEKDEQSTLINTPNESIKQSSENDTLDHRTVDEALNNQFNEEIIIWWQKSLNDNCSYQTKEKKKKKKEQGKNKKWKVTSIESYGFEFSLLPRRTPVIEDITDDMEKELEKFEKLEKEETNKDTVAVTSEIKDPAQKPEGEKPSSENAPAESQGAKKTVQMKKVVKKYKKVDDGGMNLDDLSPVYLDFEYRLTAFQIYKFEDISGSHCEKHIRRKHKWKVTKAHKQVKNKHCATVSNCYHGETLYICHRVVKRMYKMEIHRARYDPGLSMNKIDKERGVDKGTWREMQKAGFVGATNARGRPYIPPDRPTPPRPRHALAITTNNADGELDADLVNILMTLQERDLDPNDYELLCRLDDRVKPKTLDDGAIARLTTDTVPEGTTGEACAICQDEYLVGECRKHLPCGHYFHTDCIVGWLKNSAPKCPLDNTEISL